MIVFLQRGAILLSVGLVAVLAGCARHRPEPMVFEIEDLCRTYANVVDHETNFANVGTLRELVQTGLARRIPIDTPVTIKDSPFSSEAGPLCDEVIMPGDKHVYAGHDTLKQMKNAHHMPAA